MTVTADDDNNNNSVRGNGMIDDDTDMLFLFFSLCGHGDTWNNQIKSGSYAMAGGRNSLTQHPQRRRRHLALGH